MWAETATKEYKYFDCDDFRDSLGEHVDTVVKLNELIKHKKHRLQLEKFRKEGDVQ